MSYHLRLEHGLVIEREKADWVLIVEVDVFADMMSVALNSQDKSWRGIYEKFLLNAMMS